MPPALFLPVYVCRYSSLKTKTVCLLTKSQCYLEHININPANVSCLNLKNSDSSLKEMIILLDNGDVKNSSKGLA